MKTIKFMVMVFGMSLALFSLACDGGDGGEDAGVDASMGDGGEDAGLDASMEDGGEDAGLDASMEDGGEDGGTDDGNVELWGECPFPYTPPETHLLEDEMGMEREYRDVHVRCRIQFQEIDAEILVKAQPIDAASFSIDYAVESAYVCRDGQVEDIAADLALFAWRHHSWKDIEIVIDENRYVFGYSEVCVGARPCTPWPDQFDVRLQADSSLIAEAQPTLCASVGETGLPVPFMEQRRIPPEGENIPFTMGSNEGDADEAPPVTFNVWPHRLDVRETSNAEFALFLNDHGKDCEEQDCCDIQAAEFRIHQVDGRWVADEGYADAPVVRVNWYGAKAYCAWRRMILPYESTWEMAASAMGTRAYPWGDDAPSFSHAMYADCGLSEPEAVCSRPAGDSREGLCNLAGNVSEWMNGWYDATLYSHCIEDSTCRDGPWASSEAKSVRGGSYASSAYSLRATDRDSADPQSTAPDRGFRCMASNPSF